MIELNLLPPEERELLNLEQLRRWVLFYGGNILLIATAFITVLILIWLFVLIQLKSYTQSLRNIEISFQGQSVDRQKQLSLELNQYLEKLDSIQQHHKYYSVLMKEITDIIPAGVRVDGLSLDKNQATLSGFAPQRTQVLLLQESLAKSQFFSDLEKPIENLVKPLNINFNFSFTIKPDKITQ